METQTEKLIRHHAIEFYFVKDRERHMINNPKQAIEDNMYSKLKSQIFDEYKSNKCKFK